MKQGWEVKKLGDVCKLEYGKPLDKVDRDKKGLYPAYGANGIKCYTNKIYYNKKSIIVGRKGSAGEVNLTTEKFWPLDVTYYVTFNDTKYDLMYLYNCLCMLNLPKLAKGVKPGINRNDVYCLSIPTPPLPIQKQIVALLDYAFERLEQAKTLLNENMIAAKELFDSALNDIFTQGGDGWEVKKLGDVCKTGAGGTPLKSKKEYYENGDIPWLQSGEVAQGKIYSSRKFITDSGLKESSARMFPINTVLVAMYGATAGQVGILKTPCATNQAVCGVYPNNQLTHDFIFYFFLSFKEQLISQAVGGAQPNVSQIKIKNIQIPIPPLPTQKKIVEKCNALSTKTKELQKIYQQKIDDLDELKQSLLQQAFAGELDLSKADGLIKEITEAA